MPQSQQTFKRANRTFERENLFTEAISAGLSKLRHVTQESAHAAVTKEWLKMNELNFAEFRC